MHRPWVTQRVGGSASEGLGRTVISLPGRFPVAVLAGVFALFIVLT